MSPLLRDMHSANDLTCLLPEGVRPRGESEMGRRVSAFTPLERQASQAGSPQQPSEQAT